MRFAVTFVVTVACSRDTPGFVTGHGVTGSLEHTLPGATMRHIQFGSNRMTVTTIQSKQKGGKVTKVEYNDDNKVLSAKVNGKEVQR